MIAPHFSVRCLEVAADRGGRPNEALPGQFVLRAQNGQWCVLVELDDPRIGPELAVAAATGRVTVVVGDSTELTGVSGAGPAANAAVFVIDLANSHVEATVSLTGLPPVFVLESQADWCVSCPFLPSHLPDRPGMDMEAVADLLRWGHPIDGRTLFSGLAAVRAGFRLDIAGRPVVKEGGEDPWQRARKHQALSTEELVAAQCHEFLRAAARLPAEGAFLSLSGGLDSRAALAALVGQDRRLPCVTLAGSDANLDAMLATAFCQQHGLDHQIVMLGTDFRARLPDLVLRAAQLTGGGAALSQAVDLYLYESLPGLGARISGNLGNQVGRGGVESLSAYDTDETVYSPQVRQLLRQRPRVPWFIDRMQLGSFPAVLFGQEVHFWSIPNYVVGSSRARQLSPYASVPLMQLSVELFARDPELNPVSWQRMRSRDVKHRLHGPPLERSFQRQLLANFEGKGSRVPLNWGWYAAGGWSPRWRLRAGVAAADAAILKLSRQSATFKSPGQWLSRRLGHPSSLVDWPDALRTTLRELAYDVLSSRDVREAGVFAPAGLDRVLAEHYAGKANHHAVLARAIEVGLAIHTRHVAGRQQRMAPSA